MHYNSITSCEREEKGSQREPKRIKKKPNGSQRGARRERKAAKGIPKGAKWESNASKGEPKGSQMGAKWVPKGSLNEGRGAQRILNHVNSYANMSADSKTMTVKEWLRKIVLNNDAKRDVNTCRKQKTTNTHKIRKA